MRFVVCIAVWLLPAPTLESDTLWDMELVSIQAHSVTIRDWKEKVYDERYGSYMAIGLYGGMVHCS